jgi:hypothetical protein
MNTKCSPVSHATACRHWKCFAIAKSSSGKSRSTEQQRMPVEKKCFGDPYSDFLTIENSRSAKSNKLARGIATALADRIWTISASASHGIYSSMLHSPNVFAGKHTTTFPKRNRVSLFLQHRPNCCSPLMLKQELVRVQYNPADVFKGQGSIRLFTYIVDRGSQLLGSWGARESCQVKLGQYFFIGFSSS